MIVDASMIVALTGVLTGGAAVYFGERGRRDQARQATAADQAMETKVRLDETQQIIDGQSAALGAAFAREVKLRERGEELEQKIDRLEAEADEQRLLHRAELSRQDARCRETTGALVEQIITMRAALTDEVARAAAATVLDRALPHPHDNES